MAVNNEIPGIMAKIRSIHEDAQLFAASELNDDALFAYLETTDAQFRSISYEGASMSRGLWDIASGDSLGHWMAYMERTKAHSVQVHIGLGWALAQRQVPVFSFIKNISPIMQSRILDGYGYYDGMFRNRTSIRDKVIPEEIKGYHLYAYDQGIGRSLWYIAKGNTAQLVKLIEGFTDERRASLWRGVGIAAAYVGGCDESMLTSLYDLALPYQIALASGAVFLAHSRIKAGTLNAETELTCRTWCHMSATEAVSMMDKAEPVSATDAAYTEWVNKIEDGIRNASHP